MSGIVSLGFGYAKTAPFSQTDFMSFGRDMEYYINRARSGIVFEVFTCEDPEEYKILSERKINIEKERLFGRKFEKDRHKPEQFYDNKELWDKLYRATLIGREILFLDTSNPFVISMAYDRFLPNHLLFDIKNADEQTIYEFWKKFKELPDVIVDNKGKKIFKINEEMIKDILPDLELKRLKGLRSELKKVSNNKKTGNIIRSFP